MRPEDYVALAQHLAPVAREFGREIGKVDWEAIAKSIRPAAGFALAAPLLVGVGAGVALGASVALLVAPRAGRELRVDLSHRARNAFEWLKRRGAALAEGLELEDSRACGPEENLERG